MSNSKGNYAAINGISMYYEVYGTGRPLVLIHGGGSTISTNFARIIPMFSGRQLIAVELQAHGHTTDRGAPSSFEQDADDVAALLQQLAVPAADILGFSNGGNTAMQLANRHPAKVRRLVLASTFFKRSGMFPGFWAGMDNATFDDMPQPYKDAYKAINPDPDALFTMFTRDATRMQQFRDWPDSFLSAIKAPALVVIGDQDIVTPEHAVEMYRLLPDGRLAILTGNHGSYLGETMTPDNDSKIPALFVAMVEEFLDAE